MSQPTLADDSHVPKTNILSLPVEIIERVASHLVTRQSALASQFGSESMH
jgi:hypothetical protein